MIIGLENIFSGTMINNLRRFAMKKCIYVKIFSFIRNVTFILYRVKLISFEWLILNEASDELIRNNMKKVINLLLLFVIILILSCKRKEQRT